MNIATARLHNQRIIQADLTTPHDVVHWLGAMQAQDYAGVLWSIALRTPSLTIKDVEAAITKGEIIRTWPMRGTLHFVAAEDARWMIELLAPRASQKSATRRKHLDITDEVIAKSKQILHDALKGKKHLSRPDIFSLLNNAGVASADQRGVHILHYLAEQAFICFGPHIGKQPSFVLFNEWVAPTPKLTKDEALGRLAERYFTSHGPASELDFTNWSGLTLTDVRRSIDIASTSLATFEAHNKTYWMSVTQPEPDVSSLFLLPGFDEFILGYRDRSDILAPEYANAIVPGGNGMFLPTLIIDGRVAGTWKRIITRNSVQLQLIPFTPLSDKEKKSIEKAAERYSKFLVVPVELTF
ncbi:MAG TPA: winged helix DNA-binding domain-containing protein [Candidatus Saccharimonadales bacterium]|nr:winged helix DNA-binding domain-containing protein [Candidatus Saccharimonadales bacterium]